MPIPADILNVERPTNTIVIAYGKNKDRYAVRQRIGCKNVDGRRLPVNGPTIGHIENGVYVPIDATASQNISESNIDLKDWGNVTLCDMVFQDILTELSKFYSRGDALKIYCISILRVCRAGIKDFELKAGYEESFLSEMYSGVALSRNTVSKFFNDLGKTCSRIMAFMRSRADAVHMDHHLLVDGVLKSNESEINSLSDFSRKARTKGTRDISVLYAFDLEAMEPVCSKCFPGNMLDLTSYGEFIEENGITKGIIVADKGFPSSAAVPQFQSHPDLHYLNPLKRNSKYIKQLKLLEFTDIIDNNKGITCKKAKDPKEEKWYYCFRDSSRAAREERTWLREAGKKNDYDNEKLKKDQALFGTVVLESDLDLSPAVAYKAYDSRWEIELVMRYYKSACEFDETRVHDDYSVIGSEFCDFLSTVLTYRLINTFDRAKLLEETTYKNLMRMLCRAKKVRVGDGEWELIRMNPSYIATLQTLGILSVPEAPPKKKRGRPPKKKS